MTQETGEPAFPSSKDVCLNNEGMTLRDYFAAKAMYCLLETEDCEREFIAVAKKCYAMADAMLKARES